MKTKYLFILLAIGALLFLFRIGERDLWESYATRYTVVAHEMGQREDRILPYFNGEIYTEKPPLFF